MKRLCYDKPKFQDHAVFSKLGERHKGFLAPEINFMPKPIY